MIAHMLLTMPLVVLLAWTLLPCDLLNLRKLSKIQKTLEDTQKKLEENKLNSSKDTHIHRLTKENQLYAAFYSKIQKQMKL